MTSDVHNIMEQCEVMLSRANKNLVYRFLISKFLMGGTQNFWSPTGTKSDGGGTFEKKSD